MPRAAVYAGTKHALFGYFESLRYDFMRVGSNVTITTCMIGSIRTENAIKNTKGTVPDSFWHSSLDCAEAIVQGGESRAREVYFPFAQTYPLFLLQIAPSLTSFLVQTLDGWHNQ